MTSTDLKITSSHSISLDKLSTDAKQEKGIVDLGGIPGGGLKAGDNGVKVWFRFESILRGSMQGYYLSEGVKDEKTGKKPLCVIHSLAYAAVNADDEQLCFDQMEAVSARAAFS